MGIEVDRPTLASVSGRLKQGADGVEAIGRGAPASVDAGEMTGLFTAMLEDVNRSAAAMVEGLHVAAEAVDSAHESYDQSEASAARSFGAPGSP